jgi:hypothetical protein
MEEHAGGSPGSAAADPSVLMQLLDGVEGGNLEGFVEEDDQVFLPEEGSGVTTVSLSELSPEDVQDLCALVLGSPDQVQDYKGALARHFCDLEVLFLRPPLASGWLTI